MSASWSGVIPTWPLCPGSGAIPRALGECPECGHAFMLTRFAHMVPTHRAPRRNLAEHVDS